VSGGIHTCLQHAEAMVCPGASGFSWNPLTKLMAYCPDRYGSCTARITVTLFTASQPKNTCAEILPPFRFIWAHSSPRLGFRYYAPTADRAPVACCGKQTSLTTHLKVLKNLGRTKLITGAQYVEYALPAFINALASVPMARPVAFHMDRLNELAVVIGRAKLVSYGVVLFGPSRTWEIPCVASDHQL
jgi:hypothetical protein